MPNRYSLKLRFHKKDIEKLAGRYKPVYPDLDHEVVHVFPKQIKARGYFTKSDLETYCRWKSPRTQSRVKQNPADYIEALTRVALSTPNEQLRIEILTLLHGVNWPSASVLLHFAHQEQYPILDYRALWSLGIERGKYTYNFDLWWKYTLFCRQTADETGVSMRTLDQALWQFSKEADSRE